MLDTAERTHEIRLSVPADPSSLAVVRRAVKGLEDVCGDEMTDRLAVICSELVTNAIRHGGISRETKVEVELEAGESGARGRVVDPGRGFDPKSVPRRPLDEGGLGLRIVDRFATRWGVNRNDETEVWFEI
jgi:anti-sigma regulatory factor (Ser/Thr protein kinase)